MLQGNPLQKLIVNKHISSVGNFYPFFIECWIFEVNQWPLKNFYFSCFPWMQGVHEFVCAKVSPPHTRGRVVQSSARDSLTFLVNGFWPNSPLYSSWEVVGQLLSAQPHPSLMRTGDDLFTLKCRAVEIQLPLHPHQFVPPFWYLLWVQKCSLLCGNEILGSNRLPVE